tara:strand:+ start:137 stop:328 length:192 start_codon:yes stop_codon:yes gene_type:complete
MILPIIDGNDRTKQKKMVAIYATVSGCSVDNPIKISASYNQGSNVELRSITTAGSSVRVPIKK